MSHQPMRLPGDMSRRSLTDTDLEIEKLHKEGRTTTEIAERLGLFGTAEVRRRLDKVNDIRTMELVTAPDAKLCAICAHPIPPRPYQKDTARACSPGCARQLAYQEHPDLDGFPAKRVAEVQSAEGWHLEPGEEKF